MTKPKPLITPKVSSIQIGRVAPLGPHGVLSGFVKATAHGPVEAGELGLSGDEQADPTVHGGPDKAVYFYPSEHYPRWIHDVPDHEQKLVAGAFGENVTTQGLDESGVTIGEVFRIGTTELQVTQPRQPCYKLGLRFDDPSLGRIMMQAGRTGWYARVLKPGILRAGDEIQILRRPNSNWTITRFNSLIRNGRGAASELIEFAGLEGLADGWRSMAQEAIDDPGKS